MESHASPGAPGASTLPVGSAKHFDRARERLGQPVEAVCAVSPGGALVGRLASAAVTQEPSQIWIMVVTRSELVVFKPVYQGLRKPNTLGDELLRIALSDIARVERQPAIMAVGFRLALTDGSSVSLRALRGVHHGREVVQRITQLTRLSQRQ